MSYLVKEIFYSIQGEGINCGRPALFIRFAGCNLRCTVKSQGFDCDTDFFDGDMMSIGEMDEAIHSTLFGKRPSLVVLTGGEPLLQVDKAMLSYLRDKGFEIAVETNGTRSIPSGIDWVCVSPKRRSKIVVEKADELKYVLAAGQKPFDVPVKARWKLISPAFRGMEPDPDAIAWCRDYVLAHPEYRLSLQVHKLIGGK